MGMGDGKEAATGARHPPPRAATGPTAEGTGAATGAHLPLLQQGMAAAAAMGGRHVGALPLAGVRPFSRPCAQPPPPMPARHPPRTAGTGRRPRAGDMAGGTAPWEGVLPPALGGMVTAGVHPPLAATVGRRGAGTGAASSPPLLLGMGATRMPRSRGNLPLGIEGAAAEAGNESF